MKILPIKRMWLWRYNSSTVKQRWFLIQMGWFIAEEHWMKEVNQMRGDKWSPAGWRKRHRANLDKIYIRRDLRGN